LGEEARMTQVPAVIDRLVAATNAHNLDRLVDCFAEDYVNTAPAHPPRGFVGREQVRRNWQTIFAGLPDVRARVVAVAAAGDEIWTEWEMSGTRADGALQAMVGVIIFRVEGARITSGRFYLEPVESSSGDVNAAVSRHTGMSS
jgi:ketosteroid isomerase-like protein